MNMLPVKNKNNPFEALRCPGIAGEVRSKDFLSETVWSYTGNYLQILAAELVPGVWDYGYKFQLSGVDYDNLPGQGSGWFKTKEDAFLYALGFFRYCVANLSKDNIFALDVAISKLRNKPLFDI